MIAKKLNDDWIFCYGEENNWETDTPKENLVVQLPHDAMILEERNPHTKNGGNTGYYQGNIYNYRKKLQVPFAWREKEIFLEFDGIYCNAMVYVNDILATVRPYGYSQFFVQINDFLNYGNENEIRVVADTSMEKDSRWYSGGGIYRDVKIYVANHVHIDMHGVRITTDHADSESANIHVDVKVKNAGNYPETARIFFEIMDADGIVVAKEDIPFTAYRDEVVNLRRRFLIRTPLLWSCESPRLYKCNVILKQGKEVLDEATEFFGIRVLDLDVEHGLRINGKECKLRGACIHHDNGIIGSVSLKSAEERKVRQLKEAGFNCIRSSHNPANPALLDACDRLGMLVMEETFDMWTIHKCSNDYACHFTEWWERDLESMVEKDYNHPSVILYSVGNEIDEAGTARGAYWNRKMADKIRSLDDTRYVTNGVNGMIVIMDEVERLIPEIASALEEKNDRFAGNAGSDELNNMISIAGGEAGDILFSNPLIGERTEQIYGAMDIAGMNYMAIRYELDHKIYPNRIILGTETFPADIARLWSLIKKNGHVIGDMTWTGYDYLGEAGCGIFRYDGSSNFGAPWPARAAYIGDINLIGDRRPVSYYREIVFGLRKEPYIAVERPEHYGKKVTKTPWMMYDDIASWTWNGFTGKPIKIRVFSPSKEVELVLNGKSLGKKASGERCQYITEYEAAYEPGELVAVGYTDGQKDGEMKLLSANEKLHFDISSDKKQLIADGEDLAYVNIRLLDENNIQNHQQTVSVDISVEGAGRLQGFGSANPECEGNYFDSKWDTFEGSVLAVIRSTTCEGTIRLCVSGDRMETRQIELQAIAVKEE